MRHFWEDESGAITVDWVVLTSALVGLGIAVTAVISTGVEDLTGETQQQLAETSVVAGFREVFNEMTNDFSEGLGDWVGGTVVSLAGFGDVLQLGPGELTQMALDVPAGATSATVSFNLIGGDDLSGEPATVYVDGQAVAIYADNHGNISAEALGGSGITVTMEQQFSNDPVGAGGHGHDSQTTVTITIDDPTPGMTVGVGSGADQGVDNEFYAIDDVSVSTQ